MRRMALRKTISSGIPMGARRVRMTIVAAVALMAALWLISIDRASASGLTAAECRKPVVVDYGGALGGMRPSASPPPSGPLPFGPAGLRLSQLDSPILAGGGEIGFSLRNQSDRSSTQSAWQAQSMLTLVRRGGGPIRTLRERQQSLDPVLRGKAGELRLGAFRVSKHPAFYRLDVALKHAHVVKARYRQYFRVVPRRVDVRLALSGVDFQSGDRLTWRLENLGTVSFIYGVDYRIERFEGSRWVIDPMSPSAFPAVGFYGGPGIGSSCQSVILSEAMAPGRYRVSKTASSPVSARERRVSSEFKISD